jgi:ATP-dependent DNA ligase
VITLPALFKRSSTGAIQFWKIKTKEVRGIAQIVVEYGQVGTDSPQQTVEVIAEGKNAGRANATTAQEQADAEAVARHEKQRKKGYVDSIESAQLGEVDGIIEGGIVPMLAHTFTKQGHKIKFPCHYQVKFDGHRCIAVITNGKCTLWSRTRKPINSAPHIVAELEQQFSGESVTLDGELYNHAYKNDFETLTSAIRKDEPAENYKIIQYHIYDIVMDHGFAIRAKRLQTLFPSNSDYCLTAVTSVCKSESDVTDLMIQAQEAGYEGIMLRNSDGPYVNKRSYDLQKVKSFLDAEFKIVGIEEGRGKLAGHAGAFVCETADGTEFKAKMSGDTLMLRKYFQDHSLWEGKLLTVKYQGLTGGGVPRFPVGMRLRKDI